MFYAASLYTVLNHTKCIISHNSLPQC